MSQNRIELPDHLARSEAQGGQESEVISQFELGTARNFYYLITDWHSRQSALVDAPQDLKPVLEFLEAHRLSLAHILLTHSHWDHVPGVPELARLFPEIPIHLHTRDRHRMKNPTREIRDGEVIEIGETSILAMHTPGHSAGEVSYFVEKPRPYLFTGDTVFIRDCGRTDLETGSVPEMFATLQRIKTLPPETIILPGHHYARECASTLGRELIESPPFRCETVEELEKLP